MSGGQRLRQDSKSRTVTQELRRLEPELGTYLKTLENGGTR